MSQIVDLNGKYTWTLIVDIDNTTGGEYERKYSFTTRTNIKKSQTVEEVVRKQSSHDSSFKSKVEAGGVIKVVNISSSTEVGYSSHEELMNQITSTSSNSLEVETTETLEETITVRAGEKFKLYQLQFNCPGVFKDFSTRSSNPRNVDVVLHVEVEVEVPAVAPGPIPDGSVFNIRSAAHGNFIRGHPGGEGAGVDMQVAPGPWEKWFFTRIRDDVYGIRSTHGTYIRGHPGGEGSRVDLQVDKHNWGVMPWEQWVVVPTGLGTFGIRSTHGTYMRAHPGGEGSRLDLQIDKHNWGAMPWEQFFFDPTSY